MVGSVAGDLPEQVKNNQSVNMAAGNGGQKMSQYSWFTVYPGTESRRSLMAVRGKVILQPQGKEFFTSRGNDFFT